MRPLCLALALLLGLASAPARAAGPPSSPAAAADPGDSEFDFDLGPPSTQLAPPGRDPKKIERAVRQRRRLLKAHQAFGFITLGALAATLVIGQLNYLDRYAGDDTGRYRTPHLGLGIASTITFGLTGLLALVAPNPYPKPIKADAALLHKVSMALATAGFIAQIILGPITKSREGQLDQKDYALAHLVTGYATAAFMTVGVFSYVF